jgi:hypothetical protein
MVIEHGFFKVYSHFLVVSDTRKYGVWYDDEAKTWVLDELDLLKYRNHGKQVHSWACSRVFRSYDGDLNSHEEVLRYVEEQTCLRAMEKR